MIKSWYIFLLLVITFTLLGTLVWGKVDPKKKFIAVGNGDVAVAVSYDGVEWDPIEDVLGANTVGTGVAIARGGGKYVVVGSDGDDEGDNVWWSHDGKIWNAADSTEGNGIFGDSANSSGNDVTYADGLWVAVGVDGTDYTRCIWWSEDGEEWTPGEGDNFGTDENMSTAVVKYDNGVWIVGGTWGDADGSPILYSEDGLEWVSADFPDTDLGPTVVSVAYDDGIWAAVGYNDDGGAIWYSEDNGESWTMIDESFFASGTDITVFAGNWVAVGDDGNMIWYSDDGINWSEASYPSIGRVNAVKFLNSHFYAFGTGYIIRSSSEGGREWTVVSGIDSSMTNGAYGDGKYVAVGNGDDAIYYSSGGGREWNLVDDQPFGEDGTLYDVIYA